MKKIVFSLVLVLGIILLAGCGKVDLSKSSRIVCTKVDDNSSDTVTTVLTISYDKNEKIENFMSESNVVYKTTMSQQALEITEKTLKLIGKIPGLSFESKVGDNSLYYSFSGNVKFLKTVMKQLNKNYDESKVTGDTKSEALLELQNDGYTCEDIKK
ncbi:MAG: hypothetical protein IK137_01905 [Bacilli bacterium]|nr:hypothetical protein [Bacilli bacterium]